MAATIPTTKFRDKFCTGGDEYSLSSQLFADVVTGASSYRFIFSPEPGPGTTLVRESTNYTVFLSNVGSVGNRLRLGQSNSVRVQALVNGTW